MKKIVAAALTLILSFGMTVTAFAAVTEVQEITGNGTIKYDDGSNPNLNDVLLKISAPSALNWHVYAKDEVRDIDSADYELINAHSTAGVKVEMVKYENTGAGSGVAIPDSVVDVRLAKAETGGEAFPGFDKNMLDTANHGQNIGTLDALTTWKFKFDGDYTGTVPNTGSYVPQYKMTLKFSLA